MKKKTETSLENDTRADKKSSPRKESVEVSFNLEIPEFSSSRRILIHSKTIDSIPEVVLNGVTPPPHSLTSSFSVEDQSEGDPGTGTGTPYQRAASPSLSLPARVTSANSFSGFDGVSQQNYTVIDGKVDLGRSFGLKKTKHNMLEVPGSFTSSRPGTGVSRAGTESDVEMEELMQIKRSIEREERQAQADAEAQAQAEMNFQQFTSFFLMMRRAMRNFQQRAKLRTESLMEKGSRHTESSQAFLIHQYDILKRFSSKESAKVDGLIERCESQGPEWAEEVKVSVKRTSERTHRIINQDSTLYAAWSSIVCCTVFYNAIFIVLRLCFRPIQSNLRPWWVSFDLCADIVYLLDILISSRIAFLDHGLQITDLDTIRSNYMQKNNFKLDLFSVIPFDLLYFMPAISFEFQGRIYEYERYNFVFWRLNRLFKWHRAKWYFERLESRVNAPNAFRIFKLVFFIMLIIHWNACIYFLISDMSPLGSDEWVFGGLDRDTISKMMEGPTFIVNENSYIEAALDFNITFIDDCQYNSTDKLLCAEIPREIGELHRGAELVCANGLSYAFHWADNSLPAQMQWGTREGMEKCDVIYQYIYCLYWSSLTLTTIGETPTPTNDFQYMFMILDFLLGVVIFASVVGNVGSMISNLNAAETEFKCKLDGVKQYMYFRRVDKALERRIVKWFDYIWRKQQSVNEHALLKLLPPNLRAEIALHNHLQTLKRVSLFADCEPGLLIEMVLKLSPEVYCPGDFVCRKGDIGKEMYIIKQGSLNVVSDDGSTVFATLKEGGFFGEISILDIKGNMNGNRRTANIQSVGYTHLFALSKADLVEAMKDYPDAKDALLRKGKEILIRDNLYKPELDDQDMGGEKA